VLCPPAGRGSRGAPGTSGLPSRATRMRGEGQAVGSSAVGRSASPAAELIPLPVLRHSVCSMGGALSICDSQLGSIQVTRL